MEEDFIILNYYTCWKLIYRTCMFSFIIREKSTISCKDHCFEENSWKFESQQIFENSNRNLTATLQETIKRAKKNIRKLFSE